MSRSANNAKLRAKDWVIAICATLALLLTPGLAHAQDAMPEPYNDDYTVLRHEVTAAGVNTTVRVRVSQDTFLSSANPNSNYGGETAMRLGWVSGSYNAARTMIQFNLDGIPSNATINSARLFIYQSQSIPSNDAAMTFRAQFVNSSWGEYGVTWNNANYLGGTSLPLESVDSVDGWKSLDVTGLVHTWHNGSRSNHGLIVTGDEVPSNNRSRVFRTRESGQGAYIDVDYSVQCDTVPPQSRVNDLARFEPGSFPVSWSGQDFAPANCQPSGIAYFDVYYRINGGSWTHWKDQTQATSNHFKDYASDGDYVELTARAADRAGNVEPQGGAQTATTIDTQPPSTTMTPLPQFTTTSNFTVGWRGFDNLSGVNHFDLQWRVNGSNWQTLAEETTITSFDVTGAQPNARYEFRVRATDNVGNVQDFPESPQTSTIIRDYPEARVLNFNPWIVKPSDPITDSFIVNWTTAAAPGTQVASVDIFYQFEGGAWTLWRTFPNNQFSAIFAFAAMGMGDGYYGFEAIATNNRGEPQPRSGTPQAGVIVDLADRVRPVGYMPNIQTGRR